MTKENIIDEVVFENEEWRDIPGFSKYQASSYGRIRRKIDLKISNLWGDKNNTNSYLNVSAVSDDRKVRVPLAHVLVCLAFHGPPPEGGTLFDVNHDDGNKRNNRPSNLEWMTRRENLIHAYRTGLRSDCCRVTVRDIQTGEKQHFYSLNNFSEHFNLSISAVKKLRFSKPKLFKDKYELEFHIDRYVAPKHDWIKAVVALDCENNNQIVTNNILEMSEIVKIAPGTIQYCASKEQDTLTNGYIFRYLTEGIVWPTFTVDDVKRSKDKWKRKKKEYRKKRSGVEIKDYFTGEIKSFDKLSEAEKHSGLSKTLLQRMLFSEKLQLYRGKSVRYKNDDREFPNFNNELVRISLDFKPGKIAPITVKDISSNTTKLYASIFEFAREKNLNGVSVANWVRLNPDRPLKDNFVIKAYSF